VRESLEWALQIAGKAGTRCRPIGFVATSAIAAFRLDWESRAARAPSTVRICRGISALYEDPVLGKLDADVLPRAGDSCAALKGAKSGARTGVLVNKFRERPNLPGVENSRGPSSKTRGGNCRPTMY